MARTPDPIGLSLELPETGADPAIVGELRMNGGDIRAMDGTGVFSLRSGTGLSEAAHKTLRQLIHLADEGGPWEGFASGAYEETLPTADPFPTSVIWWTSSAKTAKIVEETVTYNANKTINTDQWKVYDTDGSTVLATATDTYAYSGIFVLSRTRVVT